MSKKKPDKVVALLEALTEELRRETSESPEPMYYDQEDSPLPRDTHCRLVRTGKLEGYKVAGRVLVKREDMHAFIESHKVEPNLPFSEDNDAVVAAALKRFGMQRKAG